ncbi:hypothetical protein CAPTEDRAFT_226422 [Capitella teleta]|uniref:Prefoldin subunit 4 n=1 Tax=Capitella teleta TaxID=283909 RepID=R7VJF8_CAPTE|nr:hypothetical protein CAPTEDRAFT_226422 [Capitella teleta]|eukprot:ELU18687.1 hypothetical protein CAPTEDRAFT_226422 [Capitella teleta]
MACPGSGKTQRDNEVNITIEDQSKINTFARHNARLQDLKIEMQKKKKELQNLEDAADELLMIDEEDSLIPYMIGEVFVRLSTDEATSMLDRSKADLDAEIAGIEAKCDEHKQILSNLKIQLYAKFGNNINLEADEEA